MITRESEKRRDKRIISLEAWFWWRNFERRMFLECLGQLLWVSCLILRGEGMLNLMISCNYHAQLCAEHTVHSYMLAQPSTPIFLLFPTQFWSSFSRFKVPTLHTYLKVIPDFGFCIFFFLFAIKSLCSALS